MWMQFKMFNLFFHLDDLFYIFVGDRILNTIYFKHIITINIFLLQPESIQKDLRQTFSTCLQFAPSVLVLDNLDILAQQVAEHTQDGEYYNR